MGKCHFTMWQKEETWHRLWTILVSTAPGSCPHELTGDLSKPYHHGFESPLWKIENSISVCVFRENYGNENYKEHLNLKWNAIENPTIRCTVLIKWVSFLIVCPFNKHLLNVYKALLGLLRIKQWMGVYNARRNSYNLSSLSLFNATLTSCGMT